MEKNGSACRDVFWHARSRVADGDAHVLARGDIVMMICIVVIDRGVPGFDREPPAARHGVAGIDGEIEQGRLELAAVGLDLPESVGTDELDLDVLVQRPAQQLIDFRDEPIRIDALGRERLAPREGQQTPGQLGPALGGVDGDSCQRAQVLPALQLLTELFGIAEDDSQQIVEIVGDAAGELPPRASVTA